MNRLAFTLLLTLTGTALANQQAEILNDEQLDGITGGAFVYYAVPDKVPPTPTGVPVPYPNTRHVLLNYRLKGR